MCGGGQFFFFDKTHICSVDHYLNFVLSYHTSGAAIKPGMFIEDVLGQQQLAAIKERGLTAHAEYATWLLTTTAPDAADAGAFLDNP